MSIDYKHLLRIIKETLEEEKYEKVNLLDVKKNEFETCFSCNEKDAEEYMIHAYSKWTCKRCIDLLIEEIEFEAFNDGVESGIRYCIQNDKTFKRLIKEEINKQKKK